jgi:hypothetical protein
MTVSHLPELNPEERRAVEHSGGGPLLVIAGAGSGKTMTLAHRVAHLILNGTDPRRILLLTFSHQAGGLDGGRRLSRQSSASWTVGNVRYRSGRRPGLSGILDDRPSSCS